MNIAGFTLRTLNPAASVAFYTETFGFVLDAEPGSSTGADGVTVYPLKCEQSGAVLTLRHDPGVKASSPYQLQPHDNYWKFSVFVDDIQRVAERLRQLGTEVSEPFQFGEVGYLAHLKDPEGYAIELIQRTFRANTPDVAEKASCALGEKPQLGLLTLRTADPLRSIRFYERECGLQLFVRMYVERGNGFTLYFLGPKHLTPPSADIDAIANREWLYQQRELFVELQHYWGSEWQPGFQLADGAGEPYGLHHITIHAAGGKAQTHTPAGHRVEFLSSE